MKKIIIAAAIVCAAALSQAATFNWSSSDVVYMPGKIASIAVGDNQAIGSKTSAKMSTWMASGATFAYTMVIDGQQSTGTIELDGSGYISVAADNAGFVIPTDDSSKTLNYSIVITGTYTDGSDNLWSMTSDTISGSETFTKVSVAALQTAAPTAWSITMTPPSPPTPTPEPTSALLMVIGMAGLALRRRRA